ncbi:MAG: NAD(P)-binding protein [Gemmatimonadota bacterium]
MTGGDRDLGMDRPISRRDFLDGVAIGVGGAMLAPHLLRAEAFPAPTGAYYPPALTGLRGSHPGAFEAFHALRDGQFWKTAPAVVAANEAYDLVIVGAGISGLAAAHYFRKSRPAARILILDNHDDFGGHAKRNEFTHEGKTHIGYGGTQSIESPSPYSPIAKSLIAELRIDVGRYAVALDKALYPSLGLGPGFFFDKEAFGTDKLVVGNQRRLDERFVKGAPLADTAKRDLRRLYTERFDPMPGLASAAKKAKLARMSYANFLSQEWKVDPAVVAVFQASTHDLYGAGIDAVPAQDAFGLGLPGFQGMALDRKAGPGQNYDSIKNRLAEGYVFHFPDGNATIARLLVRTLIPAAIPGTAAEGVVMARADYSKLDLSGSPVRIRLKSPVMRVRHLGDPKSATGVEVTYLRDGKLQSVTGGAVVLACWHSVIPYLCPELPVAQKEAMAFEVKVPLIYTNVLIRNWTAFQKLGVSSINAPGLYHTHMSLDYPVSLGGYHHTKKPTEPIVVHMSKSACKPGLPIRAQHRAGRTELFTTSFETIERSIRAQLARVLGPGGFDPARDIVGLTVNRWPHGYAYQYNSLFDDFWLNGGEQPCVLARKPHGRIAIANADSGAYSYTDAAIDHGHRAAGEILAL